MNLKELVQPWVEQSIPDCLIIDLKNDSRTLAPGDVFVAYPGAASDGRLFINNAIAAGAAAIIYDPQEFVLEPTSIPCIAIAGLAGLLPALAQRFFGNPSHLLSVTGVTGTNGKTTIAYQLAQAHALLQERSAYIGTIGQGEVHDLKALANTTPDALCVQRLLKGYQSQGIKQVCMEVSSHALSQHRVDGIEFKEAIFTNLTLDHLDYHHTMEAYAQAKAQLFAYESLNAVVVNQDDGYSSLMLANAKPSVRKITYGFAPNSDVRITHHHSTMNGSTLEITSPWGQEQITIQAPGRFNMSNALAVFTSLMLNDYPKQRVVDVMSQLKAAPGRMEVVATAPYVLVDYAHTPDALENALITLKHIKKGDLWVLFGCGGDRDKSKRPLMGAAAATHADKVIVTSDNPRTENPERIINEIKEGIPHHKQITELTSRKEAIVYALEHAKPHDIILIAGKGHESYQQIGTTQYDFSDQKIVREILKNK